MDRRTFLKSAAFAATAAIMAKGFTAMANAEAAEHNTGTAQATTKAALPGWRLITPAEITDNPVTLFGKDWMALAVGNQGEMNAMTVGWGGLGTLWTLTNAVVTLYIDKSRYTRELLEKNQYFTLTALPPNFREALSYLGSVSGRNEDKVKGSGLTPSFTALGNPIFEEGRLALECRKIYAAPLSREGMIGQKGIDSVATGREFIVHIGEIENIFIR